MVWREPKIDLASYILTCNLQIRVTLVFSSGTVSACRYWQKQKGYRNFPPASIFALGLTSENSLKNHIFY